MSNVAYARAGDAQIAYRVMGEAGRIDVVVVAGALVPFELLLEDRVASRFITGLGTLGRVAVFDKRGVGLSDPVTDWSRPLQEQWAEDLLAVVQGAGLQQPVLVSWEPNGVARRAVSTRPDLFGSMVLLNPSPSTHALVNLLSEEAAGPIPGRTIEERSFPSRIRDADFDAWLARAGRSGASPSSAARLRHIPSVRRRPHDTAQGTPRAVDAAPSRPGRSGCKTEPVARRTRAAVRPGRP